jgi:hypothetical protein
MASSSRQRLSDISDVQLCGSPLMSFSWSNCRCYKIGLVIAVMTWSFVRQWNYLRWIGLWIRLLYGRWCIVVCPFARYSSRPINIQGVTIFYLNLII